MSGVPKRNIYFPDDCEDESAILIEATAASINDLNQPLTSLLGMFSLFKRRMSNGDAADAVQLVERMEAEVERMAQLTRRLNRLTDDTARTDVVRQRIISSKER